MPQALRRAEYALIGHCGLRLNPRMPGLVNVPGMVLDLLRYGHEQAF
jgi:hypothetical protein